MADAKVAVLGSMNPGKLQACQMCFAEWLASRPAGVGYEINAVHTDSGVSEQPMTIEETTQGAKNRAERALKSKDGAAIGIGMESGVFILDGKYFDFCVVSVFDGSRHCIGISSMFALPPAVAATFQERGYNQSFKDAGVEPDENGDGVLAHMSGGALSRPKQMKESFMMALLQLHNPSLYS